jgi:hypothetical protein
MAQQAPVIERQELQLVNQQKAGGRNVFSKSNRR